MRRPRRVVSHFLSSRSFARTRVFLSSLSPFLPLLALYLPLDCLLARDYSRFVVFSLALLVEGTLS